MVRGFKKSAEEISEKLRCELSLAPTDPLKAAELARHLGIHVIIPSDIPGLDARTIHQLLLKDSSGWSAVTLQVNEKYLVIHNPAHSPARTEGNLMHEIAHIIRKHRPGQLLKLPMDGLMVRSYNKDQEDEANWLGPCLQIPRCALLRCVLRGMTNTAIAKEYYASVSLIRFRRNMTGVDRQARHFIS